MSNKSGNEILIIGVILIVAIASWIAHAAGVDFPTGMQMLLNFVFVAIWTAFAYFVVQQLGIRLRNIFPSSGAAFFLAWIPAFDFWGNQKIDQFGFAGSGDSYWLATGWIQVVIALSILVVGQGLIYWLDSDTRY